MSTTTSTSNPKIIKFSEDVFLAIGKVAKPFWERGVTGNPPKFVILMGGVATGKTTVRRQQYATGFVHFDYGEIHLAFEKMAGKHHPRLADYAIFASDLILRESIAAKKNIVIEIIGDNYPLLVVVIDKMKEAGYDVSVVGLTGDVAETYTRHLKAVEEDLEYISAYHTQEATLSYFFSYFGLQQPADVFIPE